MDVQDLDTAEDQLSSLLHKCEPVLRSATLSPSRLSLMDSRVRALRTALELVREERERRLD